MSAILAWAKSNLVIVILMVLAVAAIPVGWYISSGMNTSLRKDRAAQFSSANSKLNSVSSVEYSDINMGLPGETTTLSFAPHDKLTEEFAQRRDAQMAESLRVVSEASAIGSDGRELLVPGLFPEMPTTSSERNSLLNGMIKELEWRGKDDRTSAYGRLMAEVRAGVPPNGEMLGTMLLDLQDSEYERIEQRDEKPTEEEMDAIDKKLLATRLGQYQLRADEISVYMFRSAFFYNSRPTEPPFAPNSFAQIPKHEQCFVWQYDYWALDDILGAIALANTSEGGSTTPVPDSTVKRILGIQQVPTDFFERVVEMNAAARNGEEVFLRPVEYSLASEILTPSYIDTTSGRDFDLGLYETRTIQLKMIVAFGKLPKLYEAIAASGIMSVVDLQMEMVDVESDLRKGFYYGDEYVVKVTMKIEIVFLRSWFADYIPTSIKKAIGIPVQGPEPELDDDLG